MKKFLTILFLGVLASSFYSHTLAQTKLYNLSFHVRDQYGHAIADSVHVSFRNTDSSTTTTNPYSSIQSYSDVASYYDSGTVASTYSDTMITIHYKACGQWYTLDTSFYRYTGQTYQFWYRYIVITAPCVNPCNAEFNYGVTQHLLRFSGYPSAYFGPFTYHWYFGDGHDSITKNPNHTYSAPGTYTVSLVILDTLNNCTDSVAKSITITPGCYPSFYANHTKYGHCDIIAGNNVHPGYLHTWVIGDSVFSNDGSSFSYRFGAGGFKPIKHIVEYPGHCKDSLVRTVTPVSCQTSIAGHQVNVRTVTIQPINNVDSFKYNFGDGTTLIAVGQVSHTYSFSSSFQVIIQDVYQYCSQKAIWIQTTSPSCSQNFGSQEDSLFKMTFFVAQSTNYSVKRIISPTGDTLNGDTVSYVFPTRGYYSVSHQLIDSLGNLYCTHIEYVYVSSCGSFGWMNMYEYIQGRVRFNSNASTAFDSLRVYLIEHDSAAGTLTALDSLTLYSSTNDTGYFEFYKLCDSSKRYLVKAALLPGSGIYANYLPTYYDQSASWSGATKLSAYSFINLQMLAGTNSGGPGFIGGLISQGANKKFNALEGVQVTLFDDADKALAFDMSDANGHYEFSSLAYGTYRVTVEILGKPSDSYLITLNQNNETANGNDFEVNSTYVSTLSTGLQLAQSAGRIYPNPAKNQLVIEWTDEAEQEITLRFYSIQGQLVHETQISRADEKLTHLDVKDIPRGMILLEIENGSNRNIQRIILE